MNESIAESYLEAGIDVEKDWTKGSITRNLLLLSWPMVLMEALYMAGQIIDMIWVGKLGPSAIAGVGIANICVLVLMSMDIGIIMGVRALIARSTGSGDMMVSNNIAGQAIILGCAWGITVAVIGVLAVKAIFGIFGAETEVTREGVAYLRIILIGWIAMMVLVMGMYSIQASGDTMKPMIIEFIIRMIHIAICPFLVLGYWVFPRMGAAGAALSNVTAHSLGAVIVLCLLFSGRTRLRLSISDFFPNLNIIRRILRIGIPATVMHMQKSIGDMVLAWIIIPFGTLAVAAHSLVLRVEMLFIAVGIGLGGGSGVLAGLNLGARHPERAEKGGWLAAGIMEAFMIACCFIIMLKAENIIGIFTSEPDLIELGSIFLRIAIAGYVMLGLVFVFQDCIAGIGDTIPTMIVSIAMIWFIQLPLAFFLPGIFDLGVYGVRWAIVVSIIAGAVFYITYFMLGKWKLKRV
ncbi:MAG: MATE family efflux transporter [Deltaproteobacteria bacterium]|nr:MATE family efflux transporter [Deltaproteobacteria bacterium]